MVALVAAGCGDGTGMGMDMGMGMGLGGGRPTGGNPSLPEGREAYTILLCPPYLGFDHARASAEAVRKTEAATGWQGVYAVHEDRSSSLYLGRYATEKEAGRDLQRVRRWKTPEGALPFQYALVTKRPGQHVGPPEWDLALAKVNPDGYTVVIGTFYNVGQFKERMEKCVENCQDLRGKGIEAYYHHGPATSYLTIGNFPSESCGMEELPNGGVRAVIVDERIKKLLAENPLLAVNGYQAKVVTEDPKTGRAVPTGASDVSYVTSISEFRTDRPRPPAAPRRQPGGRAMP